MGDYKRLLALARPELRTLAWGTLFLLIGGGMGLLYPQAVRITIDRAIHHQSIGLIDQVSIALVAIFLIQGLSTALRSYLFNVAGERIVARLRKALYANLIAQEIAFFDQRRTGELLNRLSSDTTILQNTVSVNISMALRYLMSVFGGIALLLYTSHKLAMLMLAIVPAVALGAVFWGRKIRSISKDTQDALAKANVVAEETISGIRTVQAFAREEYENQRYADKIEHSFALACKKAVASSVFMGIITFAAYGAIAIVLWYGGRLVIAQRMSLGDLTSFLLYTMIVAFALAALGSLWTDLMRATGATERIFELIDRKSNIPVGQGHIPAQIKSNIQIQQISFAYPSRQESEVLRNFDLELRPGEIVAIVGASGSGKSTIASLIPRFYDPNSGAIYLDQQPITTLDPTWLRQQIGIVSQEPLLFSTSIYENILYGNLQANRTDVENAAKDAYAHDFIIAFPDGYDTLVGERGLQLSGGQKQRIAIARALLKDPHILILDEATSALDAESEHLVKKALNQLMQGRTTLIIAHRLSTVKDAHRVVVLDQGQIAQSGTHTQLIAQDGIYRRLVERQFIEA